MDDSQISNYFIWNLFAVCSSFRRGSLALWFAEQINNAFLIYCMFSKDLLTKRISRLKNYSKDCMKVKGALSLMSRGLLTTKNVKSGTNRCWDFPHSTDNWQSGTDFVSRLLLEESTAHQIRTAEKPHLRSVQEIKIFKHMNILLQLMCRYPKTYSIDDDSSFNIMHFLFRWNNSMTLNGGFSC